MNDRIEREKIAAEYSRKQWEKGVENVIAADIHDSVLQDILQHLAKRIKNIEDILILWHGTLDYEAIKKEQETQIQFLKESTEIIKALKLDLKKPMEEQPRE